MGILKELVENFYGCHQIDEMLVVEGVKTLGIDFIHFDEAFFTEQSKMLGYGFFVKGKLFAET